MSNLAQWIQANYVPLLQLIGLLFGTGGVLEIIFRLVPTKNPDSLALRVGKKVDSLLDMAHVPNRLKPEDDVKPSP